MGYKPCEFVPHLWLKRPPQPPPARLPHPPRKSHPPDLPIQLDIRKEYKRILRIHPPTVLCPPVTSPLPPTTIAPSNRTESSKPTGVPHGQRQQSPQTRSQKTQAGQEQEEVESGFDDDGPGLRSENVRQGADEEDLGPDVPDERMRGARGPTFTCEVAEW